MKREVKRGPIRPMAWLLGLGIPLGLLALVLALATPRLLTGHWPLGIGSEELQGYARLKGLALEDERTADVAIYRFGAGNAACALDNDSEGWRSSWFEADGYGDQAEVTFDGPVAGTIAVRFKADAPFNAQRGLRLVPATVESIRAKYLEILATELELPVPEVTFVRVIACGRDLGIHVKEEMLDPTFLAKRRMTDATLFRAGVDPACPQGLFPVAGSDTLFTAELRLVWSTLYTSLMQGSTGTAQRMVDQDAAIGWLLMRWLEDGDRRSCEEVPFMHRRTTGALTPLFERAATYGGGMSGTFTMDPASALLKDAAFREALKARREKLNEERWRVKERFAAMDRAWLPVLAGEGDLAWAGAIAARIADNLLEDRLAKGDPLAYHDRIWSAGPGRAVFLGTETAVMTSVAEAVEATVPLDRIAARFRSASVRGDSLVFGRGKYEIEAAIVLPPGKALILEKGARITIAPGSGITVQGPFQVRGTNLNPVFVRPMDNGRPFKGIEVRADGRAECSIAGLQMSGGGAEGAAMIMVQGASNVRFRSCELGSAAGVVLEVSGGRSEIADCLFLGGTGPLLALDHVRARVRTSTFRGEGRNKAGNALRIAGERASVDTCTFTGMTGTAVNAGDATQVLLRGSRFEGNAKAVEAIDLAVVHVAGNTFVNNALLFSLKRVDPVQGGARVLLYTNELNGNANERELDKYSAIEPQERLDPKVLSDFGLR